MPMKHIHRHFVPVPSWSQPSRRDSYKRTLWKVRSSSSAAGLISCLCPPVSSRSPALPQGSFHRSSPGSVRSSYHMLPLIIPKILSLYQGVDLMFDRSILQKPSGIFLIHKNIYYFDISFLCILDRLSDQRRQLCTDRLPKGLCLNLPNPYRIHIIQPEQAVPLQGESVWDPGPQYLRDGHTPGDLLIQFCDIICFANFLTECWIYAGLRGTLFFCYQFFGW